MGALPPHDGESLRYLSLTEAATVAIFDWPFS